MITDMGGYEFHDWKIKAIRGTDKHKLDAARLLVRSAMSILETIDDEYVFPTSEYETLDDVQIELENWKNEA